MSDLNYQRLIVVGIVLLVAGWFAFDWWRDREPSPSPVSTSAAELSLSPEEFPYNVEQRELNIDDCGLTSFDVCFEDKLKGKMVSAANYWYWAKGSDLKLVETEVLVFRTEGSAELAYRIVSRPDEPVADYEYEVVTSGERITASDRLGDESVLLGDTIADAICADEPECQSYHQTLVVRSANVVFIIETSGTERQLMEVAELLVTKIRRAEAN